MLELACWIVLYSDYDQIPNDRFELLVFDPSKFLVCEDILQKMSQNDLGIFDFITKEDDLSESA